MAAKLAGKIAVVTGAAGGIGSAICRKFASEGASLVLVDINCEDLNEVYESLTKEYGDKHMHASGDVSDSNFATELFSKVQEKYSCNANVLVNCAGIFRLRLFIDLTEEEFDKIIRVNLKSVFVMTKAFVATLKTEDGMKSASIINISSLAGKSGLHMAADYSASKAGILGFSKTIGIELGQYGVRCNAVMPGATDTKLLNIVAKELVEASIPNIPMKRMGRPEEVANACSFLASDESSYVNCACLEVTGGFDP